MTKLVLRVGILIAIVGVIYCVFGMLQLASYSAGPNYPSELATQHFRLWLRHGALYHRGTLLPSASLESQKKTA